MTPEDIKALRKGLHLTARQLARALDVEGDDVVAWEAGERFPTKRLVTKMLNLREAGSSEQPAAQKAPEPTQASALENPKLWAVVRRLVEDPAFLERVAKAAEGTEGKI